MKDDTISRAAALDALGEEPPVWYDGEDEIAERNQWRRDVAAIKALPSATDTNVGGNLIDRQAAIDALNAMKICRPLDSDRYVISDCMNKIAALSSVQPEQRWIPWSSGKLPEESGTYTVTAYDGVTKRVTYAKYQKRLKRWELTGARAYWRVVAWMPLPTPWKGGQDGKN